MPVFKCFSPRGKRCSIFIVVYPMYPCRVSVISHNDDHRAIAISSARTCRIFGPLRALMHICTLHGARKLFETDIVLGARGSHQPCSTSIFLQIIYVTGGEELTIVSTAPSATMENVRIEAVSFTKLILDAPDLTVAGIFQSVSHSNRGSPRFSNSF